MQLMGMKIYTLVLIVALLITAGYLVSILFGKGRFKKQILKQRTTKPTIHPHDPLRKTDAIKLTKSDEIQRDHAFKLIASSNIVEGAKILEQINLHRFAISALESAGKIDEACNMLLKMNRPNRAAVVYTRHKQHLKAAVMYLKAGLSEDAATSYAEAGKEDPRHFLEAGKLYDQIGNEQRALECYAAAGKSEKVVHIALKSENWMFLRDYMKDEKTITTSFELLDPEARNKFIESLPIEKTSMQALAKICEVVRKLEVVDLVLKRISNERNHLATFWMSLSDDFARHVVKALTHANQFKDEAYVLLVSKSAHALFDCKRYTLSAKLYEFCGRLGMAAKCWAMVGELERCMYVLRHSEGDELIARSFEELLKKSSDPTIDFNTQKQPWSAEVIAAANRILSNVDPDKDELQTISPFSMSA